jgi:hypothetical protein
MRYRLVIIAFALLISPGSANVIDEGDYQRFHSLLESSLQLEKDISNVEQPIPPKRKVTDAYLRCWHSRGLLGCSTRHLASKQLTGNLK